MIVDCLDWHYKGDYPKDLDKKNAGTHIGMYLAWIINSNLESEELINIASEDIKKLKNREITGRDFLINNCNGILNDKLISKEVREFTFWYYLSSREDYCQYLDDYLDTFINNDIDSLYKLDDSWDNYEKISYKINTRYKKWKESK